MVDLQARLGLRFEESAKADTKSLLVQATSSGRICITDGTKGGRDRVVPITSHGQIEALSKAVGMQGNHHSLIPEDMSYRDFQASAYRGIGGVEDAHGYHGFRHEYAQGRYEALVKAPCPISAGIAHGRAHHEYLSKCLGISLKQAQEIDHDARKQIAEELGHSRIEITNVYLG